MLKPCPVALKSTRGGALPASFDVLSLPLPTAPGGVATFGYLPSSLLFPPPSLLPNSWIEKALWFMHLSVAWVNQLPIPGKHHSIVSSTIPFVPNEIV